NLNGKEGVSFLLAEQNTNMALKYARYGYILENGRVVMDVQAKALRENEKVKEFYLGIAEGKRKSFRDGKHYKRRKRWLARRAVVIARESGRPSNHRRSVLGAPLSRSMTNERLSMP